MPADREPPTVLHLLPETEEAGAEKQARYLLAELKRSGRWHVELAYFRAGRGHQRFAALDIPLHEIPRRSRLIFDLPGRVLSLRRLIERRRVSLIHAWLNEANLVAALAAGLRAPPRVIISQRCAKAAYFDAPYWPWALRGIRRRVDHAIANSADGIRFLGALGYAPARMSLISNGIPAAEAGERAEPTTADTALRVQLDLGPGEPVVGFVGRADRFKDLGTLFAAMEVVRSRHPEAWLVLIGPTTEELRSLGLALPARAKAIGWHQNPRQLIPAFDVLAVSSITEGHSNAVDEALMCGVPVATTDVGDHPALVADLGGRVVPARRADLLGHGILELLSDPPPREALPGKAAERLSMRRVLEATEDVYLSLLRSSC
jgi:glycosyltransferase involved in cell wall biosynthesis